jgi:hypothetical protein
MLEQHSRDVDVSFLQQNFVEESLHKYWNDKEKRFKEEETQRVWENEYFVTCIESNYEFCFYTTCLQSKNRATDLLFVNINPNYFVTN